MSNLPKAEDKQVKKDRKSKKSKSSKSSKKVPLAHLSPCLARPALLLFRSMLEEMMMILSLQSATFRASSAELSS